MNLPKVDIILVSYNTVEYILRAIASVYEETSRVEFNLIIVDNDSQDGSAQEIRSQYPEVTLIESGCNLGFARGVNLGASYASGDYILLLNPDTVVLDNAIDKLVDFSQKNLANGIWGGVTLNNDLSINTHNAWAEESISNLFFSATGLNRAFKNSCFFNYANYGCWNRNSVKEIDVLQGSFFLTSNDLWGKLQGLDEAFFMYAEEADYCYRAKEFGCQPIITPDAKIIHHGGGSEINLSGKMIKLLTGKVTFINKHHSILKQFLMKSLLFMYVSNKLILSSLISLVKPSKKSPTSEWLTIFQASREWLKGYQ